MKKKLEAELISIAHRVLKLKNRSETKQLQEEARKLYEQLSVLRFYEENFEAVKDEIPSEKFEQVLSALDVHLESEPEIDTLDKKDIVAEMIEEVEEPIVKDEVLTNEPEAVFEEELQHEDDIKSPQPALFDDVFANDYKDLDFVKVEDVPAEVEKVAEMTFEAVEEPIFEAKEEIEGTVAETVAAVEAPKYVEPVFEAKKEIVEEEPRTMSLNDRLTKGINIGLNDRIAFEKKLFGGSSDDFNRVVSQLNTFDSFDEAKGFIDDFVKPDYNNWDGKEEFENRFLEIVEKKFS